MCGIYSILSKNVTINNLTSGLKKIQNRGYDSCGILLDGVKTQYPTIFREISDDKQALDKMEQYTNIEHVYNFGMGHTRWATHGNININNTHPHVCYRNELHIVHNGVVENLSKLKDFLIKKNIYSKSNTDTEVIANYLSFHLDNLKDGTLSSSILNILNTYYSDIEGTNTVILYYKKKCFVCKNINSLVLMKTDDVIIIASEKFALPVGDYYVLKDGVYEIDRQYTDDMFLGISTSKKYNDHVDQIQTNVFNMEVEINEQRQYLSKKYTVCDKIKQLLYEASHILLVGCGSSYNASLFGECFFRNMLKKNAFAVNACDYSSCSIAPIIKNDTNVLVVVISQSGETIDTYNTYKNIKKDIPSCSSLGITNSKDSLIYNSCDQNIYLDLGREIGVASTKSFTGILNVFTSLIMDSVVDNSIFLSYFDKTKQKVNNVIDCYFTNPDKYLSKLNCMNMFILANNICFPLARESCLKIKEISYINAQAYALSDLKHGPFALIEPNNTLIFIIHSKNQSLKNMISTRNEINCRGGDIIVLSNDPLSKNIINSSENIIFFDSDDINFYYQVSVFFQMLSMSIGMLKHINIDMPRNLAKCVTVI